VKVLDNYNLIKNNTFAVDCYCDQYIPINSLSALEALPRKLKTTEVMILGAGSNILFTKPISRTVIHLMPRKHITQVDNLTVVWAGTPWHDLVMWAVQKNLGGIENLALIPGLVGAAPIQNIGAYGAELKDVLAWVEIYNWQNQTYQRISNHDCKLGYRNSIFKRYDHAFIVTRIALDLREDRPINLSYESLKERFEDASTPPSYAQIANEVIKIRQNKLPDPNILPNAGSFFKNPIIPEAQLEKIKKRHVSIPYFKTENEGKLKVSAAWLIETCGFKGTRDADAGFSDKHALVLVNHGRATGVELLRFSKLAKRAVKQKFDIKLEEEIKIL